MKERLRLRATMTVEVEYEVDITDTDDPQKVVDTERTIFDQAPANLLYRNGAKHRVNVENITDATTDQLIGKIPIAPWSPEYTHIGTQTGRITRTIEIPPGAKDA